MPVERNTMGTISRHIGSMLIEVNRIGGSKFLISASSTAREAAPLVFADR